ncbi:MAG: NYN domain-containing protein [Candidatus Accumulibacter sp.]|nr:NYN domain-containing protein [Accumulibacter sp.]
MASSPDAVSMALFCDFENVALGVRDANYEKFDIKPVLERLLLKGSIVVKKAYCDWDRYKAFKATMHEANFELIEIPHVRQSGKNSADIRMVVDALDLCYTKSHVDTFVIISGDSDFSPLVSKLRENAKHVIGVGVKQSTSDLLIANCDEFIFYDDLVRAREAQRSATRRDSAPAQAKRSPEDERKRKEESEARKNKAIDLVVATLEDLMAERADGDKIWASVLKEAIKRRKPDFNEAYYGFRAFGNLLQEAQARGFLEFGRDEKSGAYVSRGRGLASIPDVAPASAPAPALAEPAATVPEHAPAHAEAPEAASAKTSGRRRNGRGGRQGNASGASAEAASAPSAAASETASVASDVGAKSEAAKSAATAAKEAGNGAGKSEDAQGGGAPEGGAQRPAPRTASSRARGRKPAAQSGATVPAAPSAGSGTEVAPAVVPVTPEAAPLSAESPAKAAQPAARSSRSRKPKAAPGEA